MYVIIDPEEKVALDPYNGIIAEMDEEHVLANLAPLSDRIDALEAVARNLALSLDPMTVPRHSYPNREGIYLNLGRITNLVYGLILGLLIGSVVLYMIYGGRW